MMRTGGKRLIRKISFYYWLALCRFAIINESTHGLSRIVSLLPKMHIVPILRHFGAKIGCNCDIDVGLMLHRIKLPLSNLVLEDNTHIGHRVYIDLSEKLTIRENSAIGSYSLFITHAGDWTIDRSDEQEYRDNIHVGKSVIIYSGCIITAGVSIGDYARIAANSTVLDNVDEYSFVAGSPAKYKKNRRHLIHKTDK